MIYILFLVLAFLTVYLSVKLSFYADLMSKKTNINKALIGGILIAGVTSLPELVTCYSAIQLDNVYLTIGDILGSNLFNITITCFIDIIFLKKLFFSKVSKKNNLVYFALLINYVFMYLFFRGYFTSSIFNIGIPSFLIIITYIVYLKRISSHKEINMINETDKKSKYKIIFKFLLTAIFMVLVSILLTIVVNNISEYNPQFSTSVLGAVLLGITTSLPEVITFISLIKLNSYDLAINDIIGSNLFNILVLAVGDIILRKNSIYYYSDIEIINILKYCFLTTLINLYQIKRKRSCNKFTYIVPSILIVFCYFLFLLL